MEFRFLYLAYLAISAFALIEVSINVRKNIPLKTYLLVILTSVFVMNLLSYISISNRIEFILIKFFRLLYVCASIMTMCYLVIAKTPKWIQISMLFAGAFFLGLRIYHFGEIEYESNDRFTNQIFSMGSEFKDPIPYIRYVATALAILAAAIPYYYYRRFFMKMNSEDGSSKKLSLWMISFVMPLFLLIIFGIFGLLKVLPEKLSPYLFCLFSTMVIFSVLYRPRFLNSTSRNTLEDRITKSKKLASLN